MMGFNWDSRAVAAAPIPLDKLPLIDNAVANQCDASDGLLDGLVQDPQAWRSCAARARKPRTASPEPRSKRFARSTAARRIPVAAATPLDSRQARRATADGMFDAFSALVDWVEQGKAPQRIIASGGSVVAARTRPLCPYPQQAVYKGKG